MYEINLANRLSHALVHFVMALASLFTGHKISGLPIGANYRHLRTIWAHTFRNSPTDPISSVRQLAISFHAFLGMTFHIIGPRWNVCFGIFRMRQFSTPPTDIHLALSLSATQVYMIQERCWFSQIHFFVEYFPHRINILFLSSQFYFIHIHR